MRKLILWVLMSSFTFQINAQLERNVAEYNLNSAGEGFIDGPDKNAKAYDRVSVFNNGGMNPLKGKHEFSLSYEGVDYLFATEANMKTFLEAPSKYEPTYGGYCARAMVVGQKVHINTKLFTIVGNRSFFFVNKRAKSFFDRNLEANIQKADSEWKKISGESPRL